MNAKSNLPSPNWLSCLYWTFLLLATIASLLPIGSVRAQPGIISFGDTLFATANATLRAKAPLNSEEIRKLEFGDTLVVRGTKTVDGPPQWKVATKREVGWMPETYMLSESQYRKRRRLGNHLRGSIQDTVVVTRSMYLKEEAAGYSDQSIRLEKGDRAKLISIQGKWSRVEHNGESGFFPSNMIISLEEHIRRREKRVRARKLREKKRKMRRKKERLARRRREERRKSLVERGFTVRLKDQGFEKNSADGISVGFEFVNITKEKTVKYIRLTLKLYNPVGEPAVGEHALSTQEVRAVGPIEPGDDASYAFENVWYSPVGSCVEVRKMVVQHIDGSVSTPDDLNPAIREGSRVNLSGDCSYEAQSERE